MSAAAAEPPEAAECRVCRCEGEPDNPLRAPCLCSGSIAHCHEACLVEWLEHSHATRCELCGYTFRFQPRYAPDAPAALPPARVLRVLVTRVLAARAPQYARLALVALCWGVVLPFATAACYRLTMPDLSRAVAGPPERVAADVLAGAALSGAIALAVLFSITFIDFVRHLGHGNPDAGDGPFPDFAGDHEHEHEHDHDAEFEPEHLEHFAEDHDHDHDHDPDGEYPPGPDYLPEVIVFNDGPRRRGMRVLIPVAPAGAFEAAPPGPRPDPFVEAVEGVDNVEDAVAFIAAADDDEEEGEPEANNADEPGPAPPRRIDDLPGMRGPLASALFMAVWHTVFNAAFVSLVLVPHCRIGASVLARTGLTAALRAWTPADVLRAVDEGLAAAAAEQQLVQWPHLAALAVGDCAIALGAALVCAAVLPLRRWLPRAVVWPVRFAGLMNKVLVVLALKMLLLPTLLGVLIDAASLRAVGASAAERARFAVLSPLLALALHWALGLTFMLLMTVQALHLRENLHPDLLAHIVRPQEAHPQILRSALRQSMPGHCRRIATVYAVYVALALLLVVLPCALLPAGALAPRLSYLMPALQQPFEVLAYHALCLFVLDRARNPVGRAQHRALHWACARLGLAEALLPRLPALTPADEAQWLDFEDLAPSEDESGVSGDESGVSGDESGVSGDESGGDESGVSGEGTGEGEEGEEEEKEETEAEAEKEKEAEAEQHEEKGEEQDEWFFASEAAFETDEQDERDDQDQPDFIHLTIMLPGDQDQDQDDDDWQQPLCMCPDCAPAAYEFKLMRFLPDSRWAWDDEPLSDVQMSVVMRKPPASWFGARVAALLLLGVLVGLASVGAVLLPLAVGRGCMAALRVPAGWQHDPLSFVVGADVLHKLARVAAGVGGPAGPLLRSRPVLVELFLALTGEPLLRGTALSLLGQGAAGLLDPASDVGGAWSLDPLRDWGLGLLVALYWAWSQRASPPTAVGVAVLRVRAAAGAGDPDALAAALFALREATAQTATVRVLAAAGALLWASRGDGLHPGLRRLLRLGVVAAAGWQQWGPLHAAVVAPAMRWYAGAHQEVRDSLYMVGRGLQDHHR